MLLLTISQDFAKKGNTWFHRIFVKLLKSYLLNISQNFAQKVILIIQCVYFSLWIQTLVEYLKGITHFTQFCSKSKTPHLRLF